jgi:DNA repair photolyase
MEYKYYNYKPIINKITKKDKLFIGEYIIDPYQNCEFRCKYCDSSYDNVIYIKNNFIEIIEEELKNIKSGTIIIGSVVDPYQKIEKKLKMTRNLLKILINKKYKIHILTKSDMILRDIDILSKHENVIVTLSITSLNKKISNFLEPKLPSNFTRFKIIDYLSKNGIKSGLAIIPILPYIIEYEIEEIIKLSLKYKSRYLLFKFLELKGFQKNIFYDFLNSYDNKLLKKYYMLYKDRYLPDINYINKIYNEILKYCKKYDIPNNIC